jgi:HAD superfamily hydrolase (TIGR01490 family)
MTLAIFDLDFTLLEGDSEWLWSEFLLSQGVVDETFMAQIVQYYRDYEAGILDFDSYEHFLLAPQTQLSPQRFADLRADYLLEIIRPRLRPQMVKRVDWHRTQRHTLLLITASNASLAEPIARLLQFPNLICTQIENGHPVGTPAFHTGKVTLLQAWLAEQGNSLSGSWGYSDSHNDLPLLQQVTHPVAVRPDAILRSHAVQAGWKVI